MSVAQRRSEFIGCCQNYQFALHCGLSINATATVSEDGTDNPDRVKYDSRRRAQAAPANLDADWAQLRWALNIATVR